MEVEMKKILKVSFLSMLVSFLVYSNVFALSLREPQIDLLAPPTGEHTLQTILDNVAGPGTISAFGDQTTAALWNTNDLATHAFSVASFTNGGGTLGIYNLAGDQFDLNTVTMGLDPFDGTETIVPAGFVSFSADSTGLKIGNDPKITGDWGTFGFYWKDERGIAFTEDAKNEGGEAKALSYFIENGMEIDYSYYWGDEEGMNPDIASDNDDWILAFNNGVGDFNDGVFYLKDMKPVPEPATMLLFSLGMLGLGVIGRKKLMKK